jgi:hypothetical protein
MRVRADASAAATGTSASPGVEGAVAESLADVETEVSAAVVAAGEDVSHFRALLRRARQTASEVASADVARARDARAAKGSAEWTPAHAAAGQNASAACMEGPDVDGTPARWQDLQSWQQRGPAIDPRTQARSATAKRARAALLKWLRGVADATLVA